MRPPVAIVVPVFNALEDVRTCLRSVLAYTTPPFRVVAIDDASTDPELVPMLQDLAATHWEVDLVLSGSNRGWTASINIGCQRAPGDVILLNSDTEVTARWNEKLASVAYSRSRVATVTPVSNAAGAFSIPDLDVNQPLADHLTVAQMGEIVERVSPKLRPDAPTGNGFCMYITRRAIDSVGSFDEVNFPRGYGEENDFCVRATEAGFVHLVDDATFIYHRRGASFGEERTALATRAQARLLDMHPSYKSQVREFIARDGLGTLRDAVRGPMSEPAEAARVLRERPTVLFVLHAGRGGTRHTSLDLARSVGDEFDCLLLTCDVAEWRLERFDHGLVELERMQLERPWSGHEPLSADRRAAFQRMCSQYDVDLVHVRHVLGAGPEVLREAKNLGLPVIFSVHDYTTVCPTLHLLDETGHFCGGHCTPGPGPCEVPARWFPDLPPVKHGFVHVWREQMALAFQDCDAFVTTSETARDLMCEHYDFLTSRPFHLIEHGRDAGHYWPVAVPPEGEPVRVACFGALGVNKGLKLISEVMQLDLAAGPQFEFHFFGALARSFRPDRLGGIVHGPYRREDLAAELERIRPSYSLLAPTTAETYCHALSETWMCRLPVLAADIGTIRERVQRFGGGWLLDPHDAPSWYQTMSSLSPIDWQAKADEIDGIPERTVDEMGRAYRDLYRSLVSASPGVAAAAD